MNRQKEILKYLQSVEFASLTEIYNNVSFSYYHNYKKHLGSLLSRMVKTGMIERIKKGTFAINKSNKPKKTNAKFKNIYTDKRQRQIDF